MLDAGNVCEFGYGRESEEKNSFLSCSFFSIVVVAAANIPLHQTTALLIFLLLLSSSSIYPGMCIFQFKFETDRRLHAHTDRRRRGKNREGSKSRRINCNKLTSNPAALHQERSGQGSLGWS
ncbi:hypothetical protein M752DRAFT_101605 [Aspergillus phoenicis ATCC 13157]|uniref:Uncharacterized protein n=1 Tax=Aspergillus phoenicis ATCC 13157 TaxID=1353007 RepID=A0A370PW00_ASPPH|nr:hypothetical protein M752DRAFT_101605 [Aspergillus phoenicis ATCC 13157]